MGVIPTPHPLCAVVKKVYSYTSALLIVRTTCTEPQCLYKGALYLHFYAKGPGEIRKTIEIERKCTQ